MGLITGEYRVCGVPGRLRPLARPWGAPGGRGGGVSVRPTSGWLAGLSGTGRVPRMKTHAPLWGVPPYAVGHFLAKALLSVSSFSYLLDESLIWPSSLDTCRNENMSLPPADGARVQATCSAVSTRPMPRALEGRPALSRETPLGSSGRGFHAARVFFGAPWATKPPSRPRSDFRSVI